MKDGGTGSFLLELVFSSSDLNSFTSWSVGFIGNLKQWVCSCFLVPNFVYIESYGIETQNNFIHFLCKWVHVGMVKASVEFCSTAVKLIFVHWGTLSFSYCIMGFFRKHITTVILGTSAENNHYVVIHSIVLKFSILC